MGKTQKLQNQISLLITFYSKQLKVLKTTIGYTVINFTKHKRHDFLYFTKTYQINYSWHFN